jgi:hypothetical protein
MIMESTALLRNHMVTHLRTQPCRECGGRGYTSIEIRESVTICVDLYPITYPVTGYKTVNCWRCKGTGRMPRDEQRMVRR